VKLLPKFLKSATAPEQFPPPSSPEIAFLGRSNVGKSSLINSLLGEKLAHVSSTPGRTRTINFIGLYAKPEQQLPAMLFADMPGYGYAKLSREISAEWPKFIEPYLETREPLVLCIALVDANVPAQESDHQLIEWLQSRGRDYVVVATKSDRLSGNKLANALRTLRTEHGLEEIVPYSVKTGAGKAELWQRIFAAAEQGRAQGTEARSDPEY
jgi:GTP-binding protein